MRAIAGAWHLTMLDRFAPTCPALSQRVTLEELLDSTSAGLRPSDMLTVLHLTHLTPALRLRNATLLPGDGGVSMGVWAVQEDAGYTWTFVAAKVCRKSKRSRLYAAIRFCCE